MKDPLLVFDSNRGFFLLLGLEVSVFAGYAPIQLVAPSAVTMAVATDAMICTMNLNVSLFVMVLFTFLIFYFLASGWGTVPPSA